ncbi:hypothetical protein D3C73_1068080 [compost metagenome]
MDIILRLLLVILVHKGPVLQTVKNPGNMLHFRIAGLHIILQQLPVFIVRVITGIQLITNPVAGIQRFKNAVDQTGVCVVALDLAFQAIIIRKNNGLLPGHLYCIFLYFIILLHAISSPLSLRAAYIWLLRQPGRRL